MKLKALLIDGTMIDLGKDCPCSSHEGPHLIHTDALWLASNRKLLVKGRDDALPAEAQQAALKGYCDEENSRRAAKQAFCTSRKIVEIYA